MTNPMVASATTSNNFSFSGNVSQKFEEKAKNKGQIPNICVLILRGIKKYCVEHKITHRLRVGWREAEFGSGGSAGTNLYINGAFRIKFFFNEALNEIYISHLCKLNSKWKSPVYSMKCIGRWDDINDPSFDPSGIIDKGILIVDRMMQFKKLLDNLEV